MPCLRLIYWRIFRYFYGLEGWKLSLAVALFTLGVGGAHEFVEWSTTLVMGPEPGMFDTQKDLLNNLCGSMLAVLLYSVAGVRSRSEARPGHAASNPTHPK